MKTDKKRMSIDIKKAVFLRIQRSAITAGNKPKIYIENIINNMYNTNKAKKAAAPKEVSASKQKEVKIDVKQDANGKPMYFVDGKRISKVKYQELTNANN